MREDSKAAYLAGLSAEARAIMEPVLKRRKSAESAGPDDVPGWQRIQSQLEQDARAACERAKEQFKPALAEQVIGGMNATLIGPACKTVDPRPVIFLHGGAYVGFSARSTLFASIPLADELARKLIALDYPLAPASRFAATVPATANAIAAVIHEFGRCFLFGDSAGGGLAVAATHHLLHHGLPAPSGLVLVSPWMDLGDRGDSRITLLDHDPLLDAAHLAICAQAYTGGQLLHPMASPVYASYSHNFPATFIACGSREILLSDSLRLYQRLCEAGATVELDVHEGMHHSFPIVTPLTPEARMAKLKIKNFLDRQP